MSLKKVTLTAWNVTRDDSPKCAMVVVTAYRPVNHLIITITSIGTMIQPALTAVYAKPV